MAHQLLIYSLQGAEFIHARGFVSFVIRITNRSDPAWVHRERFRTLTIGNQVFTMTGSSKLLATALSIAATLLIAGCAAQNPEAGEDRPFFQQEQATETHGRKNWFDHLIEVDPGRLKVDIASDYQEHAPAVLAVLPFCDQGSGNFTVDKIPVTFRNAEAQDLWTWTDAQRLRRAVTGYLSQREFVVLSPIAVDAVLKEHGIDSMRKLRLASPIELGRLLGADALVYGEVDNYEGYYFGLLSAYQVGISTSMVSTRDGETLMRQSGGRYSVDLSPALSPEDAVINSIMTLLEFRDVHLARAEEEVSRELVLRIPVSDQLQKQMAAKAVQHADEIESQESDASALLDNHDALRAVNESESREPESPLLTSRPEDEGIGQARSITPDPTVSPIRSQLNP